MSVHGYPADKSIFLLQLEIRLTKVTKRQLAVWRVPYWLVVVVIEKYFDSQSSLNNQDSDSQNMCRFFVHNCVDTFRQTRRFTRPMN